MSRRAFDLNREFPMLLISSRAVLCTAVVVALGILPARGGELSVSTDFEGGSGIVQAIDPGENIIRIVPTKHEDRGWVCWWYIKVSGATPGETLTLDVGGGVWATPDCAAVSTDGKTWQHTEPGNRIGSRIVYKHKLESPTTWFAWGPPYTPSMAQAAVEQAAAAGPFAESFVLTKTREDRPVPALRIRQPGEQNPGSERLSIWIQARQHAWESGSSWVCQGFIDWIVSDDPRAKSLRERADITIVPVMDVDSVAIGAGGKNQVPHDHNRDWGDKPIFASVRAAIAELSAAAKQGRGDVFIDLHNPGSGDKSPFFFITPRNLLTARQAQNLDLFLAACKAEMTGPLKFTGRTRASGANYDPRWEHISKNWVSRNTTDHVVSVTLETSWNTPHSVQENYQQIGRELGLAVERFLSSPDRQGAE